MAIIGSCHCGKTAFRIDGDIPPTLTRKDGQDRWQSVGSYFARLQARRTTRLRDGQATQRRGGRSA